MQLYPQITRVAKYLPSNRITNDDLSKIMETSNEWIASRTGIRERRISIEETTSDLATGVAKQLVKELDVLSLDFIIIATMTADYGTPSTACLVQNNIGAKNAFCLDINAACSGFIFALSTAEKFLSSGKYQRGLVVGAETMSTMLNWEDRSTAVLFGDGAAGVLLENSSPTQKFFEEKLQSDGTRGMALFAKENINHNPFKKPTEKQSEGMKMEGKQIFDFALRDVSKNMLETLNQNLDFKEGLDYCLAHQANIRILEAIAKKTKIPMLKMLHNVQFYGNTSAASVPLLLVDEVEKGTLTLGSNQKLMLTGYGAGLTWGSILLKL
ncbi:MULTISPECIES: beta-ketoacyl-ACP synthase III [Vagococcus]|uniref:Beta-ketoacyl-[acyl-carrier-protein] synthase III n=1 Tax=Vagococcus fluvialis bH819 TaxID=1255619 RepID=A0A1X6WRA9_9ENTE|nr:MULTISPECIES: beta-ketoacyl-ACP synthase III [Vagococcus]SLM86807.1 3-oxoacyl-[acyl-carrier-protein] synthase, KASIII [Vagococcus fluvialis bH819]HCM88735.1 ketoacyl-ACP synthase III [Vagococcus sp.]